MFLNKKCLKRHFSFLIVLLAGDQLKAEAFVGKKWQGNILPINFLFFIHTTACTGLDRRIQVVSLQTNDQKSCASRTPSCFAGLQGGWVCVHGLTRSPAPDKASIHNAYPLGKAGHADQLTPARKYY